MEEITFTATLYPRGQCVSFDAEGEATVKLAAPASEIAALLQLAAYGRDQALSVTVKWQE